MMPEPPRFSGRVCLSVNSYYQIVTLRATHPGFQEPDFFRGECRYWVRFWSIDSGDRVRCRSTECGNRGGRTPVLTPTEAAWLLVYVDFCCQARNTRHPVLWPVNPLMTQVLLPGLVALRRWSHLTEATHAAVLPARMADATAHPSATHAAPGRSFSPFPAGSLSARHACQPPVSQQKAMTFGPSPPGGLCTQPGCYGRGCCHFPGSGGLRSNGTVNAFK